MRAPMTAQTDGSHILVANQHGENRGDEAAMRGMLSSIAARVPDARFTVLTQLADRDLVIDVPERVEFLPMFRSAFDVASLAVFSMLLALRIRARFLLTRTARDVIDRYESVDLVISAPGGPYFGDLYSRHELFHWLFVWLAPRHGLPVVLYAPSVGPFRHKLLNRVRRRLFPRFVRPLCVREPVSADSLRALLGESVEIEITADAALQQRVEPQRAQTVAGHTTEGRVLVAVSAIDFAYPRSPDPARQREQYDATLRAALEHLHETCGAQLLLFPQLYGTVHSDVPYLERLASSLPQEVAWEIVDPTFDSDAQRALLGGCDLCIASRYHPQVFAISAGVPGVCIYYEHKALGVMRQVGLDALAFDITTVERTPLLAGIDDALARHDELSAVLRDQEPGLRARSERTTEVAVDALRSRGNVIA
jgi:colanic acid/amylovoran biosynthesis protein